MAKKTASATKKTTKARSPRKKAATQKAKSSTKSKAKKPRARAAKPASRKKSEEAIVTVDRRRNDRRAESDNSDNADAPKIERRKKVNRRRQIDPTTCERDYTNEEVEFMNALDDYKRASGRMFPTCSEVLEVVRSLGYVKASPTDVVEAAVAPVLAPVVGADVDSAPEESDDRASFGILADDGDTEAFTF